MISTREERAEAQAIINDRSDLEGAADAIRMIASAEHVQYSQYEGHWDGWRLGRVSRRLKTKMGVAFEKGDLVIFTKRDEDLGSEFADCVTAYSVRNGIDTVVRGRNVKALVT